MGVKIIVWTLINCLLPLLPPGLILVSTWFRNQAGKRFALQNYVIQILGDGQLFFYCTSLASATISDLLTTLNSMTGENYDQCVLSIVILLILVLISAPLYGSVISIRLENPNNKDAAIKTTFISLITSLGVTIFVLYARYQGGLFK